MELKPKLEAFQVIEARPALSMPWAVGDVLSVLLPLTFCCLTWPLVGLLDHGPVLWAMHPPGIRTPVTLVPAPFQAGLPHWTANIASFCFLTGQ